MFKRFNAQLDHSVTFGQNFDCKRRRDRRKISHESVDEEPTLVHISKTGKRIRMQKCFYIHTQVTSYPKIDYLDTSHYQIFLLAHRPAVPVLFQRTPTHPCGWWAPGRIGGWPSRGPTPRRRSQARGPSLSAGPHTRSWTCRRSWTSWARRWGTPEESRRLQKCRAGGHRSKGRVPWRLRRLQQQTGKQFTREMNCNICLVNKIIDF